jgi:deoxyribonuclease V
VRSRKTATGLDVSYADGSSRAVAAAVTLRLPELSVAEAVLAAGEAEVAYIPGSLALREAPLLLRALAKLASPPEVLVCDGYGIAHPRRFGLACHVGQETGLPTFGAWSELMLDGEVVGRALRTRAGVKPVFVSVGHEIEIEEATELTLAMCPQYRLPECIREADSRSRAALRA